MMAFGNPYGPVITKVTLPFSSPIPGGLTYQKQIQIQGILQNHPNANGFSINLCEGPKLEPNCHLHFNPRFHQNCIVRNAMQGHTWGPEERQGGLPLLKGQIFEVIIMATASGYQIAVNGRHFTEFKHRLPMASAKYLFIDGDFLEIKFIKYEGGNMPNPAPAGMVPGYGYPPGIQPCAGAAPPPYTPGGFVPPPENCYPPGTVSKTGNPNSTALSNPPVPLTQNIPGGMLPDRMIYISGRPHPDAKRFTINLQTASELCDIAFHFDVRLNYGNEHKVIVRNTLSGGQWGREERSVPVFPFNPNAAFDMIIMGTHDCFKVAVNNAHFISYNHRMPMQKANTLKITGDVRITSLRFQ